MGEPSFLSAIAELTASVHATDVVDGVLHDHRLLSFERQALQFSLCVSV